MLVAQIVGFIICGGIALAIVWDEMVNPCNNVSDSKFSTIIFGVLATISVASLIGLVV